MKNKHWIIIILIGLTGQLAWMLENMYLNVYLFNELGGSSSDIALMVALSAIVATITTLIMGSLSDRLGLRKKFVVMGYLFWGISVLAFGWINNELITVSGLAVILLIFWDCVMTFLGSSANDAAFNAWITDISDNDNRSKIESVISIMPLIAMLIIFGLLDPLTQNNQWKLFFLIIGFIVFISGLVAMFLMEDVEIKKENASLIEIIQFGFKSETIQQNKSLYLSFVFLLILSISTQIWMPFLIIYIQKTLLIENYALILGVVLIVASIVTILIGRQMDKKGVLNWVVFSFVIQAIGLISMSLSTETIPLIVAGTLLMSGNMLLITIANSLIRRYTPESMAGRFQGLRMIFGVMLPMIIGPFIGSLIIQSSNRTYEELGVIKQVPTSTIFIGALVVLLFIFIPVFRLKKEEAYEL